ncbi:MAG: EF-hand domain-containing protein [Verrucomicrobiae bacterium]|nr:EF-hand domain-containing protein [Verrucomicrobiae bacterium]
MSLWKNILLTGTLTVFVGFPAFPAEVKKNPATPAARKDSPPPVTNSPTTHAVSSLTNSPAPPAPVVKKHKYSSPWVERFDSDGDGYLNATELEEMKTYKAALRKKFMRSYDRNGDGKIDQKEKARILSDIKRIQEEQRRDQEEDQRLQSTVEEALQKDHAPSMTPKNKVLPKNPE